MILTRTCAALLAASLIAPSLALGQGAAPAPTSPTAPPVAASPSQAAPQSVAPQLPAAQSDAPQITAAQTATPRTSAPQTSTPQNSAPQPATPQTPAPQSAAPADAAPTTPAPAPGLAVPSDPAPGAQPAAAGEPVVELHSLPRDLSPLGMFLAADLVVKAVMIGLAFASVLTWTIWLAKTLELFGALRRARRQTRALAGLRTLDEIGPLPKTPGPVASFVRAAQQELSVSEHLGADGIKERVTSRLERIEAAAGRRMSRGTGILATIGATAPFVGLFGTVWGIMNSFIGISKAQTTNLAVVAPGIAEALLATALGLVAAIPAVVVYNLFARQTATYRALLGDGAAEVLRLVSRDLDRAAAEDRPRRARAEAAE